MGKYGRLNKKPIYKRTWFIVLAAILIIGAIGNLGEDSESKVVQDSLAESSNSNSESDTVVEVTSETDTPETTIISEVTVEIGRASCRVRV